MLFPEFCDQPATGYPVQTFAAKANGATVAVNDFGRCDGIKKIKGFSKIVAEQKREITARRKIEAQAIEALKPEAKRCASAFFSKEHDYWKRNKRKHAHIEAWHAEHCPDAKLEHFRIACGRLRF